MSRKKRHCLFWTCDLAMKECKHEDYVVAREKMTMEEALKKHHDLSFCEDWVLGSEKGEYSSPSHRLMRTCCPSQYDKNEKGSIYKEFRKHDKWLKLASKCKESWQEFEGIPALLPSCKVTKYVCDYDHCPKNVWKKEEKK